VAELITRTGRIAPTGRSIVTQQRATDLSGLEKLTTAFGELGDTLRQKKLQNDLITAKIAFEMERSMPGGLEPEAEAAFNNMTAENSANAFINDFRLEGDTRASLILANEQGESPVALQTLYNKQVEP